MDALKAAVRAGAAPGDLGRSLAYAAALRVARSAVPASTRTGRRPTMSSATPTPFIKWSSGSAPPTRTVTPRPPAASCTARWRSISPTIWTRRRRIPGDGGDLLDDLPADGEPLRAALLDAFGRWSRRRVWWRAISRSATRRCGLSRLSDAGGRPVRGMGLQIPDTAHRKPGSRIEPIITRPY